MRNGKKLLLLVDDDPLIAFAQKDELERHGYSVITELNGEMAVSSVKSNNDIDLVLMDVDLGNGIDGPEAASRILKIRDLPVVFLSSHTEPEVVTLTEGISSYGYVVKNSGETVLLASLRMAFRLHEAKQKLMAKESALEISEYRYRHLFESLGSAVAVMKDNCFYDCNDAAVVLYGAKSKEQLVGKSILELSPEFQQEGVRSADEMEACIGRAKRDGKCDFEWNHVSLDRRNFTARIVLARMTVGVEEYFQCIVEDITLIKRHQEEIDASEQKLNAIFNIIPDPVAVTEIETGRLRDVNDAYARWSGYPKEELMGRTTVELGLWMDPLHRQKVINILKTNAKIDDVEVSVHRRDGSTTIMLFSGRIIDIAGKKYLLTRGHDVTERITGSAQLKISESMFADIVEDSGVLLWKIDANGRITYLNNAWQQKYGVPAESMSGKLFADYVHPLKEFETDSEIANDQSHRIYRAELLRSDKPSAALLIAEHRYVNDNGEFAGSGGAAFDISAVMDIYSEVSESRELDNYFQVSLDLLCIADLDGHFRRLNPEWKAVLGYEIEDLVGKKFLDYVHPDDVESTLDAIKDLSSCKTVQRFVNRYRAANGSYKWIEWNSYPFQGKIYAVARDISEHKDFELYLKNVADEKQALLNELQHRVKNSMALIISLISLESRGTASAEARAALENVRTKVVSFAELYTLLYKSGAVDRIRLDQYLEQILRSFSSSFVGDNSKITFDVSLKEIETDVKRATSVGLILNEIITNALKYAFKDAGGIVSVVMTQSGDQVNLSISDNGKGLPQDFDIASAKGLGMQICRVLTTQLGGRFTFERLDVGTGFTLTFPLAEGS